MLETVMLYIHNWFEREIVSGHYTIASGRIVLPFLMEGQYYRIVGSVFNDGLHQYGGADVLTDEEFDGEVWALAPPRAFLDLAGEIGSWVDTNQAALDSPYTSENVIGVYSYTMKSGGSKDGSDGISWQSHFRTKLNAWRKVAP